MSMTSPTAATVPSPAPRSRQQLGDGGAVDSRGAARKLHGAPGRRLPSGGVVADAPADLALTPLNGSSHTLEQWLTTFHLVTAALDPFTAESAWLLPTVGRMFRVYDDADCRVAILVTCSTEQARQFLGPYASEFLTFADPERQAVKGLGLERLPALVWVRQDLSIGGAAEGWHPPEWDRVASGLSRAMDWTRPVIPGPRDPAPYAGTPALG